MSYDYWNFVGNTNNQPRGYNAERLLKVPWYLRVTDRVMNDDCQAGLNKHSSSSKVKQTLQRKLRNLLSGKATQRLKSIRQNLKTWNPASGVDDSSQKNLPGALMPLL